MGCGTSREKIEDQMMKLKLVKMEIQMERENNINRLSELNGLKINYASVPDYIDPEFAITKKIFFGTSPDITQKLSKENTKIKNTNPNTKTRKNKKSKFKNKK